MHICSPPCLPPHLPLYLPHHARTTTCLPAACHTTTAAHVCLPATRTACHHVATFLPACLLHYLPAFACHLPACLPDTTLHHLLPAISCDRYTTRTPRFFCCTPVALPPLTSVHALLLLHCLRLPACTATPLPATCLHAHSCLPARFPTTPPTTTFYYLPHTCHLCILGQDRMTWTTCHTRLHLCMPFCRWLYTFCLLHARAVPPYATCLLPLLPPG